MQKLSEKGKNKGEDKSKMAAESTVGERFPDESTRALYARSPHHGTGSHYKYIEEIVGRHP